MQLKTAQHSDPTQDHPALWSIQCYTGWVDFGSTETDFIEGFASWSLVSCKPLDLIIAANKKVVDVYN